MKNKQRGLSLIIIILIIASVLIIIGAIIYFFQGKPSQTPTSLTGNTTTSEASTTETVFSLSSSGSYKINYQAAKMAIEDKADILIANPTTDKPEIKIKNLPTNIKDDLNTKRRKISEIFKSNPENLSAEDLTLIISFLEDLQKVVANLSPSNSGLSTTAISNYQSAVTGAQNDIQTSLSSSGSNNNEILPNLSPFDRFGRPRLIEGPNRN